MKKFSLTGLLLGLLLSAVTLGATDVTGNWSGTLQREGQAGSQPAYMILKQDGNKLSGSGGPNEADQHSLEGGKAEGNKLTFDIPLGDMSMHFELEVQGDRITGQVQTGGTEVAMRISLTRVAEK